MFLVAYRNRRTMESDGSRCVRRCFHRKRFSIRGYDSNRLFTFFFSVLIFFGMWRTKGQKDVAIWPLTAAAGREIRDLDSHCFFFFLFFYQFVLYIFIFLFFFLGLARDALSRTLPGRFFGRCNSMQLSDFVSSWFFPCESCSRYCPTIIFLSRLFSFVNTLPIRSPPIYIRFHSPNQLSCSLMLTLDTLCLLSDSLLRLKCF